MRVAERIGGIVVNADSQQLYADLPILSARPTAEDEARVPHRLYGLLRPDEQASVGRWLGLIEPLLARPEPLIVTGGSGLYIEALLKGIAPTPPVDAALRARLQDEAEGVPTPTLHARLAAVDPLMAARLRPSDRQRVLRALEVIEATGRSLAEWQTLPRQRLSTPPLAGGVALLPPSALVNPRIAARLKDQLALGAATEVANLLRSCPALPDLPIGKLHGCRELIAVGEGRLQLRDAEASITAQVRQYAKRQRTFFRHRLPELTVVQDADGYEALMMSGVTCAASMERRA
jgi:tRNA dimethylallyltransferase